MFQKNSLQDRLKCKIEFTQDEEKVEIFILRSSIDNTLRFEDKYECQAFLGQGAHAVVKLAKRKGTNDIFAVKIMRMNNEEVYNNVKRTFYNSRCLRHQNIIQEYELYINEKYYTASLVMEYCPYPSLEQILKDRGTLKEEEVRKIIKQLLMAVGHIQSKGISHRDIKPDNILVNIAGNCELKLLDFGVSSRFIWKNQNHNMLTKTGNIYYSAPEIYHQSNYSKEIDLWSIGVIMFQCLTGELPLQHENVIDHIELLGKPEMWNFLNRIKGYSLNAQNLISLLLLKDPNKRIGYNSYPTNFAKDITFKIGGLLEITIFMGKNDSGYIFDWSINQGSKFYKPYGLFKENTIYQQRLQELKFFIISLIFHSENSSMPVQYLDALNHPFIEKNRIYTTLSILQSDDDEEEVSDSCDEIFLKKCQSLQTSQSVNQQKNINRALKTLPLGQEYQKIVLEDLMQKLENIHIIQRKNNDKFTGFIQLVNSLGNSQGITIGKFIEVNTINQCNLGIGSTESIESLDHNTQDYFEDQDNRHSTIDFENDVQVNRFQQDTYPPNSLINQMGANIECNIEVDCKQDSGLNNKINQFISPLDVLGIKECDEIIEDQY